MSLVHSREIECKVSKEKKKVLKLKLFLYCPTLSPLLNCLPDVTIHLLQKVKPAVMASAVNATGSRTSQGQTSSLDWSMQTRPRCGQHTPRAWVLDWVRRGKLNPALLSLSLRPDCEHKQTGCLRFLPPCHPCNTDLLPSGCQRK